MDPISLAIGAVLLAGGFFAGRLSKRGRAEPRPVKAVCGCGHGLDKHDPKDNTCHSEDKRPEYKNGKWTGSQYVKCACRQYVGPKPLEELFAPKFLPPTD